MPHRIMIVEDEGIVAMNMAVGLRDLGYEVVSVESNGQDAIAKAHETSPDLILMDIVLDGEMDGIDAANAIKSYSDIPIVFLTAYADEKFLSRATESVPAAYLVKPVDARSVHAAIQTVLHMAEVDKRLKQSEAQYRSLVETQTELICRYLPDGTMSFVNEAYCRHFGKREEELIGHSSSLTVLEEDREKVEKHFTLFSPESPVHSHEFRVMGPDGGIRWLRWTDSALFDAENKLVEFQGVGHDITGRKVAEDVLKRERELFKGVVDNIPVMLAIYDPNLQRVQLNAEAERLLGWSTEEANESDFMSMIFPDPSYCESVTGSMRALQDCWRECEVPAKDGSAITSNWAYVVLSDKTRIGIGLDIREQKRVESALREAKDLLERKVLKRTDELFQAYEDLRQSEERYRMLVENTSDLIFSLDSEGRYTAVNEACCRALGLSADRIIGKSQAEIGFSEEVVRQWDEMCRLTLNGDAVQCEIAAVMPDGRDHTYEVRLYPMRDSRGEVCGIRGLSRDISKEALLRRQLLQAQKMEALGTLSGGIAHDFNNLLTVVVGYSELLLANESVAGAVRVDLERIAQAGRNGADLVRRLLTFGRKLEPQRQPLDLNQQAEAVKQLLFRTIPKMIEIELNLAEDLVRVNADPVQMEQILMNLAVNARDAMSEEGKLTIETRNVVLDDEYCSTHLSAKPGKYALLTVSDNGVGMDKETLDRIFEPFFTTKDLGQGTGLGLAVVYGIVEQHGGHVTCYSEKGAGTTFSIYLPGISEEADASQRTAETLMPRGGTETILVVDDEELIRDFAERVLQHAGYSVLTATNGREALEVYTRAPGMIDMVLLDLVMPEMGGRQCLEELLHMNPQVKVLIGSGYWGNDHGKDRIEAAAAGFVEKPYKSKELLKTVREVLDSDTSRHIGCPK